jgi:hypothetical protein
VEIQWTRFSRPVTKRRVELIRYVGAQCRFIRISKQRVEWIDSPNAMAASIDSGVKAFSEPIASSGQLSKIVDEMQVIFGPARHPPYA